MISLAVSLSTKESEKPGVEISEQSANRAGHIDGICYGHIVDRKKGKTMTKHSMFFKQQQDQRDIEAIFQSLVEDNERRADRGLPTFEPSCELAEKIFANRRTEVELKRLFLVRYRTNDGETHNAWTHARSSSEAEIRVGEVCGHEMEEVLLVEERQEMVQLEESTHLGVNLFVLA